MIFDTIPCSYFAELGKNKHLYPWASVYNNLIWNQKHTSLLAWTSRKAVALKIACCTHTLQLCAGRCCQSDGSMQRDCAGSSSQPEPEHNTNKARDALFVCAHTTGGVSLDEKRRQKNACNRFISVICFLSSAGGRKRQESVIPFLQ